MARKYIFLNIYFRTFIITMTVLTIKILDLSNDYTNTIKTKKNTVNIKSDRKLKDSIYIL